MSARVSPTICKINFNVQGFSSMSSPSFLAVGTAAWCCGCTTGSKMTRWRTRKMPRMTTSSRGHGQPPLFFFSIILSSCGTERFTSLLDGFNDDALAHEKDAENDDFFQRARCSPPPPPSERGRCLPPPLPSRGHGAPTRPLLLSLYHSLMYKSTSRSDLQ